MSYPSLPPLRPLTLPGFENGVATGTAGGAYSRNGGG